MADRRKWMNVKNNEGRKIFKRLRNKLKRVTDKAKTAYVMRSWNFKEQHTMI
jgi:hypothetical protein